MPDTSGKSHHKCREKNEENKRLRKVFEKEDIPLALSSHLPITLHLYKH
jgi:hypothetical protein